MVFAFQKMIQVTVVPWGAKTEADIQGFARCPLPKARG